MSTNNGSHSNKAPVFSSNQGFNLPIEAWTLLKDTKLSELKVILCVLFNHYQIGMEAQPVTFGNIVDQTGMSRSSVLAGIEFAVSEGFVFRTQVNGQARYEPAVRKNRTHDMTCSLNTCLEFDKSDPKDISCHESEIELRREILDKLLEYGLAYHVAENIALTNRYDLARLERQLSYIQFEMDRGLTPKRVTAIPGYIVNRIKFDRMPPPDFEEAQSLDQLWVR